MREIKQLGIILQRRLNEKGYLNNDLWGMLLELKLRESKLFNDTTRVYLEKGKNDTVIIKIYEDNKNIHNEIVFNENLNNPFSIRQLIFMIDYLIEKRKELIK